MAISLTGSPDADKAPSQYSFPGQLLPSLSKRGTHAHITNTSDTHKKKYLCVVWVAQLNTQRILFPPGEHSPRVLCHEELSLVRSLELGAGVIAGEEDGDGVSILVGDLPPVAYVHQRALPHVDEVQVGDVRQARGGGHL
jgi:hypothetical protein